MSSLLASTPMLSSRGTELNLVKNGDFSAGLQHWNSCGAMVSEIGTPGNPHVEIAECCSTFCGYTSYLSQAGLGLPEDATSLVLSLTVWGLSENAKFRLALFDEQNREYLLEQSSPDKSPVKKTYDISGLRGTNQKLVVCGGGYKMCGNIAVDDITIAYRPGTRTTAATTSLKNVTCIMTSTVTTASTSVVKRTETTTLTSFRTQTKLQKTLTVVSTETATLLTGTWTSLTETWTYIQTETHTYLVNIPELPAGNSLFLAAFAILVPLAYVVGRRTRRASPSHDIWLTEHATSEAEKNHPSGVQGLADSLSKGAYQFQGDYYGVTHVYFVTTDLFTLPTLREGDHYVAKTVLSPSEGGEGKLRRGMREGSLLVGDFYLRPYGPPVSHAGSIVFLVSMLLLLLAAPSLLAPYRNMHPLFAYIVKNPFAITTILVYSVAALIMAGIGSFIGKRNAKPKALGPFTFNKPAS
jgi:hypothetical protein